MLLLATAVIIAAPSPTRATASVQATATIRVERAVRVKLDGSSSPDASPPRESHVTLGDGSIEQVKVIEFE